MLFLPLAQLFRPMLAGRVVSVFPTRVPRFLHAFRDRVFGVQHFTVRDVIPGFLKRITIDGAFPGVGVEWSGFRERDGFLLQLLMNGDLFKT